jgi:hypothetical protein
MTSPHIFHLKLTAIGFGTYIVFNRIKKYNPAVTFDRKEFSFS